MTDAYHGTPITPTKLLQSLRPGEFHFCASYYRPDQIEILIKIADKLMLDNGAFSAWMASEKRGTDVVFDAAYWSGFYAFVESVLARRPDAWFIIPDVINAGTQEQEALLRECPVELVQHGAPVWHMDEPISRSLALMERFDRVCFGSTAEYRVVGSDTWRERMDEMWNAIMRTFGTIPHIHMLRGLQCQLPAFDYPFASADSTDVARNHNRLNRFDDLKEWAFLQRLNRWNDMNCPVTWPPARLAQLELFTA